MGPLRCGPVSEQPGSGTDDEGEEPAWPGEPLASNAADLLRGMICVGKKQAHTMLREPRRRASEVRGLAGLLDAYVGFDEGPHTSAFFAELDSREKSAFSYRLGMGTALLGVQRRLEVPWLMHAEALLATGAAKTDPGDRPRTELVGLSRGGQWCLVKARGRSSELTDSLVDDTLATVNEVARVNDRAPAQRRACVVALGESPFRLCFAAPDPAEEGPDEDEPAPELHVDPSAYITEYYAQFSFLTSLDTKRHELEDAFGCGNLPDAVVADLPGIDYEIGLLEPLHSALLPPDQRSGEDQTLDEAVPAGGWAPDDPEAAHEAGLSVGRDGVLVAGPTPRDEEPTTSGPLA